MAIPISSKLLVALLAIVIGLLATLPRAEAAGPAFILFEYADGNRIAFVAGEPMYRLMGELQSVERIDATPASFDTRQQASMGLFWGKKWGEFFRSGADPTELVPADAEQRAILFLGTATEPPVIRVENWFFQLDDGPLSTYGTLDGDRPLSPVAEQILKAQGVRTRVGVPVALPGTGSGGLTAPNSSPDLWLLPLAVAVAALAVLGVRKTR